jgi:hypothetical protein
MKQLTSVTRSRTRSKSSHSDSAEHKVKNGRGGSRGGGRPTGSTALQIKAAKAREVRTQRLVESRSLRIQEKTILPKLNTLTKAISPFRQGRHASLDLQKASLTLTLNLMKEQVNAMIVLNPDKAVKKAAELLGRDVTQLRSVYRTYSETGEIKVNTSRRGWSYNANTLFDPFSLSAEMKSDISTMLTKHKESGSILTIPIIQKHLFDHYDASVGYDPIRRYLTYVFVLVKVLFHMVIVFFFSEMRPKRNMAK